MNAGAFPVFAYILFELYNAVTGGEDGKVASKSDALSRVYLGAELAHNDVARKDMLPAEAFYTPALPLTVATVA